MAHILIVEDDQFIREIYIETLKSQGYEIDTAIDGEEAYTKIKQGNWDLVLLDIVLPKMDGLGIIKKINNETPDGQKFYKKLVFLTNLDNDSEIKEATMLGNGYLIKSKITPGELLDQIKKYLIN